jgi:outer membrane cobalamin receptor
MGVLVTAEDIAAMGDVTTAWDVVRRRLPHQFAEDGHGTPRQKARRGMATDAPLVTLDGVRLLGLHELELVPAGSVASIRILSGVDATTLFGLDARGGVVLVRTRDGG